MTGRAAAEETRPRRRALRRVWAVAVVLVSVLGPSGVSGAAEHAWRADVPCGRVLDAPRETARPGCAAAACVTGPDGDEICVCKDGAAGDLRLVVARSGSPGVEWPVAPMLGEPTAFRVTLADLDGDGRAERLVSVLDAVSNGMAVQSWTTCVLDGRDPSRARACIAAADVPFLSLPTGPPPGPRGGASRCRLLAARWRWGSEPRRGHGLYLVGRWLAYRAGVLRPDPHRPAIARRYLYRFAAERADAIEHARTAPILWWRDATTRVLRCPADPLCADGDGS